MERESRREAAPVPQLEELAEAAETGTGALRDNEVSGSITVDDAGLDPMTLADMDELSGRSQGALACRLKEAGLLCTEESTRATS